MTDLTKWAPRLITGTAAIHAGHGLVVPRVANPHAGSADAVLLAVAAPLIALLLASEGATEERIRNG